MEIYHFGGILWEVFNVSLPAVNRGDMFKKPGILLLFGLLAVSSAAASTIEFSNASFELQAPFDQSAGCNPGPTLCYNFSITGWNIHNGSAGTFDPSLSPAQPT